MEKHRKYADINEKTILAEKMLKTLKVLVIFYGNTFHWLMEKYDLIIWAHHGMFAAGPDFDTTFGLMHTAEKSAEILVKTLSMTSKKRQTITSDDFRSLARDFNLSLPEEFLYEKE